MPAAVSARQPIRIRDRLTGETRDELVFGGDGLQFLYGQRRGRLLADYVVSRRWANRCYGIWQRLPRSRRRIPEFVRSLGIDASEAELPVEAYRSLDDFFTRRLRAGARPVDATPSHLVAPADGRALAFRALGTELSVKGCSVSLAHLLQDDELAERYRGGAALVIRLAPADYHRFHFPESGVAGAARPCGTKLHSVHPIALGAGAPSFANKRAVTLLDTERFGRLLLVEVGAMLVGTIVQSYRPGAVARGQEKGMFRFGGSTVILVAEPGRVALDEDLLESTAQGIESAVRMGTRVGVRSGQEAS